MFGGELQALKRRLHPISLNTELPGLYTRYHAATFADDKQALGRDIVRVQRALDDTDHAAVFGVIDRAYAEVCHCRVCGLAKAQVPPRPSGGEKFHDLFHPDSLCWTTCVGCCISF